jgi:hypothetical protein
MRLTLTRTQRFARATIGELAIEGQFECFTLEDVVRAAGIKVPGATAIPEGDYPVQITWSPRFKTRMPLLLGVPGFEGIRIHPGNTDQDTEGCILVGQDVQDGALFRSRPAYNNLFTKLDLALQAGESVRIDVVNGWRT